MIEINLLPPEMRKSDGTPLPRLLTIIVGIIVLALGMVFASNYHFVKVKGEEAAIRDLETRKKAAEKITVEVDKITKDIEKFQLKVNALNNLELSRIRYSRLLFQIRQAMIDGSVLSSFKIKNAGGAAIGGPVGSKYEIELKGYTTGANQEECARMFDTLYKNFKKYLMDADLVPVAEEGKPLNKYAGYNNFLKLKFIDRIPGDLKFIENPKTPKGLPKDYRDFVMPKMAAEFLVKLPLVGPPLEQGGG